MKCAFEHLNINYSLIGVDSYGYYDEATGEFNGLVHAIQRGKADVSGNTPPTLHRLCRKELLQNKRGFNSFFSTRRRQNALRVVSGLRNECYHQLTLLTVLFYVCFYFIIGIFLFYLRTSRS